MKRLDKSPRLMTEINITPFTDVILVLLIIFIIATPLITQHSIEIKLPEASTKDTADDAKQVYITISGEGIVYLKNKIVTNKELRQSLKALLAENPDVKVMVAADQACRFQEVVRVIDTVKEIGVKGLNIATRSNN